MYEESRTRQWLGLEYVDLFDFLVLYEFISSSFLLIPGSRPRFRSVTLMLSLIDPQTQAQLVLEL